MAAFGVLVTKKDQTLANLSCVSPRQGLFSEIVYSDSQAFANETEDQMDAWLDTVIAAQKLQRILIRKLKEEMPRLRESSVLGRERTLCWRTSIRGSFFLQLPQVGVKLIRRRVSLQTEIGTVHVDEYQFPYGCFGTTKADALLASVLSSLRMGPFRLDSVIEKVAVRSCSSF